MKLVGAAEMRRLEQAAVDAGATWDGLMEQAGWGVAQEALRLLGNVRGKAVLVLVGPGNNGGDGLVIARHLHDVGAQVSLYLWRRTVLDRNLELCRERKLFECDASTDSDRTRLGHLLENVNLVVDALLGIGVTRSVEGDLAEIIETLNARKTQNGSAFDVLAVDVPTGLDADTGTIHGTAVQADITVATGAAKRGPLLYPGRAVVGHVRVADIGITPQQLEGVMSEQMTADVVRRLLPARPNDSHKGTFGKVMVVAGSLQYPGASVLATTGALRVGAGLVTLATGRAALGVASRAPEVTLRPLPDEGLGALGEAAANELLKHLDGYTAMVVGPGLGHEEPTQTFLTQLFGLHAPKQRGRIGFQLGSAAEKEPSQRAELPPVVVDADGLNLLAQIENWWEQMPMGRMVLTPHPGEMQRLLQTDELPGDAISAAEAAAQQWRQVVVLKGATTVVAHPDGRSSVLDGGNAALATAGTGDVLAGAIGGLLAQGLGVYEAAVSGVYLHNLAGRLVRDDLGDAGTIASDLLPRLPLAIKQVKG